MFTVIVPNRPRARSIDMPPSRSRSSQDGNAPVLCASETLPYQVIAAAVSDRCLPRSVSMPPPRGQTVVGAVEEVALNRFSRQRKILDQIGTVDAIRSVP